MIEYIHDKYSNKGQGLENWNEQEIISLMPWIR